MASDRRCVAVVDDDPVMVKTFELLFRHMDVPLAFAAMSGPAALEKMRNAEPKPGVVFVDYRMPLMSGLELMLELKKMESGAKVVFISGDEEIREEALRAGGDAFLKKPSKISEIMDCIESLTGAR
jgi:FixJ family two-component response regulator